MRKRLALYAAFIGTALAAIAGCATETPPSKDGVLEIESAPPLSMKIGDTSSFFTVSKTVLLATGGKDKNPDYSYYHLVSSDTSVVGVFEGKRLIGLQAGSADVKAKDDRSPLESGTSVKITVTAP